VKEHEAGKIREDEKAEEQRGPEIVLQATAALINIARIRLPSI